MITIHRTAADRVDIDFDGEMDEATMHVAIEELLAKSEGMDKGRLRYRVHDFEKMKPGAVKENLKNLPALGKFVQRFGRIAIVADQGWVRAAGRLENFLFPNVRVKSFEPQKEAEAEAWLMQVEG